MAWQVEGDPVGQCVKAADNAQWPVGRLAPQPFDRLRQDRGMRGRRLRTGAMVQQLQERHRAEVGVQRRREVRVSVVAQGIGEDTQKATKEEHKKHKKNFVPFVVLSLFDQNFSFALKRICLESVSSVAVF